MHVNVWKLSPFISCLLSTQAKWGLEGMKKRQVQINPLLFLVCFWTNNMKTPTLASLLAGAPHLNFLRHKVLRVSFRDCFRYSQLISLSTAVWQFKPRLSTAGKTVQAYFPSIRMKNIGSLASGWQEQEFEFKIRTTFGL